MAKMKPSKYQKAIFDFIKHEDGSLIVEAVAGSGKTTTIVGALKKISSQKRILFCAFNKSIATELSTRVPDHVQVVTLNGLGHRAWMRYIENQPNLNSNKTYDILKSADFEATYGMWNVRKARAKVAKLVGIAKSVGLVPGDCDTDAKGLVPDTWENWEHLIEHYDIDFGERLRLGITPTQLQQNELEAKENAVEMARECLRISLDMWYEIDFNDQLYLPVIFGAKFPRHDFVFVDEAQDISAIQRVMLKRSVAKKGGRLIAVGDPHQCQPGNTKISLTGGKTKRLKDVKIGDEVVSYDRHASAFIGRKIQGRKILAISNRKYSGTMFTIFSGEKKTEATYNHRWLVRFLPHVSTEEWNCVYLMENVRGDFRVGWCQLFYKNGGFHLAQRCRVEKAKSAWVLDVFDNKSDASAMESIIAAKFGLPTITFQPVNGANLITKEYIAKIFSELGWLSDHAKKCLDYFNRSIEYPFYSKNNQTRQGGKSIFVTQSCNLIPKLMAIPLYEDVKNTAWRSISVKLKKVIDLDVYSLKVETHKLYVANGILTHNSIYGFRGADSESLTNIAKDFKAVTLPLSISYRCPKSIVKEAQKFVSHIKSSETAPEGTVNDMGTYDAKNMEMFKENDFVVCRNTAPLVRTAFDLIRNKKPAVIVGRDIGKSLITVIERMGARSISDLIDKLSEWKSKETRKILDNNPEASIQKIEERFDCIMVFIQCSGAAAVPDVTEAIDNMFSDDNVRKAVRLSTIHKAKGLEADRVIMLDSWLLPSKYAKKDWQKVQENNLSYVAITRSKNFLGYVKSPTQKERL